MQSLDLVSTYELFEARGMSPGDWLSYQVADWLDKRMVLHKSGREEKGEANDYGYESTKTKLRDDKALVPYAA
jgi:hypothetical protein